MKVKFFVQKHCERVLPLSGVQCIKDALIEKKFVVVTENDDFKGVLTVDDIVKRPHNLVIDCLHKRPRIDEEDQVDAILDKMKESGFSTLPVFRKDEFIGIIRQADIISYLTEYNEELEKKIQIHTSELQKINERLIEEIHKTEKAQKESQILLEQMYHLQKVMAIGTLAGGIAHDFNNILSPIIGYTELAMSDVAQNSPVYLSLQEIYKAGILARDLVAQIMTYARQNKQITEPVMVGGLIKEGIKLLRAVIPVSIQIHQSITTDALVKADPTRIQQIYLNLCINAYHAMEESGGILSVCVDEVMIHPGDADIPRDILPGRYVKIKVSDTGSGIPNEYIHRIFDPYFTTKEAGKGTGMGLSVVHGIVNDLLGAITVESKPWEETVFSVYLPVLLQEPTEPETVQYSPFMGNEKIFLIDDEISVAMCTKQNLERLGYEVTVETNAIKAFEIFKARPYDFDIAITDMTMPGLTGDLLSLEFVKIRPEIPIILCTGYNSIITGKKASEFGVRAIAYKPLRINDLSKLIRTILSENALQV